jgi:hypothetical protein
METRLAELRDDGQIVVFAVVHNARHILQHGVNALAQSHAIP